MEFTLSLEFNFSSQPNDIQKFSVAITCKNVIEYL